MPSSVHDFDEWLEADGLGGFASGTTAGRRTRRYHALLLVALDPPTQRVVLVNGLETFVATPAGQFALSSHRYAPGIVYPDGAQRITSFTCEPWPTWEYELENGTRLRHEVLVPHERRAVVLTWRLLEPAEGVRLVTRPLLSCRGHHTLLRETDAFDFTPLTDASHGRSRVRWHPHPNLPAVAASTNGDYAHDPCWYRRFVYIEEQTRGYDHQEDLASPGTFSFDLTAGEAMLCLAADDVPAETPAALRDEEERRRAAFPTPLERAADAYIVRRGGGRTIVAGYPWFADWGRDTFISLRGLCLATGRLEDARNILLEWAGHLSQGMLPNRFPDEAGSVDDQSVDAPLWYVTAVHDYLRAAEAQREPARADDRTTLERAVLAIIEHYTKGTRYRIHCDDDGLIAAGEPGHALTWMDAEYDGRVVTPRIGKPVEIQALWVNALRIAAGFLPELGARATSAQQAFETRFWNEATGTLHDVVDVDHRAGTVDPALRPNQIFAVGGLPFGLLPLERARRVVDAVERHLITPLGPRSLTPEHEAYQGRYAGDLRARDNAYHQGTVWPWLFGPFIEAWVRVRGSTPEARRDASTRFLPPLLDHLDRAGLGHISEIADGDAPYTPRGCPFQAWSVAEFLRVRRNVLADGIGMGMTVETGSA